MEICHSVRYKLFLNGLNNEKFKANNRKIDSTDDFLRQKFRCVPKSVVDVYSVPSLPSQASTRTKSATNDGMLHFKTAVFPFITYSDTTSAS